MENPVAIYYGHALVLLKNTRGEGGKVGRQFVWEVEGYLTGVQ